MMLDRQVSLTAIVAAVLWTLSGTTVAAAAVFALPQLGPVGLFGAVVAMTVTVRYWLSRQQGAIRNAFQLGRDTGRDEAESTQLRTVR